MAKEALELHLYGMEERLKIYDYRHKKAVRP